MNRTSDFRQKEVINISDGRRLGFVCDVEINLETGRLDAIVIPGEGRFFGLFGKDGDYVIPWSKIKKIGEDIILVEFDERNAKRHFE
ncbi:MAG: PRC-barrel domain protein [Firmicutes bacterium ADurb.Bin419]|nr:MAG: PRC-barrel domain protein [Firmicutes bacterium ADurb.Bin419]